MKKLTLILSILSSAVIANSTLAKTNSHPREAMAPVTPIKTLHISPSADLVNIDLPDGFIEQQAVHFSQALSASSYIHNAPQGFETFSDEYWFEATGKQLNQGVSLAISSPGALVRLSGKQVKGQFAPAVQAIDPEQIHIFKDNVRLPKAIQQTVSQEAMATANIFPNSSALRLNKKAGTGEFNLRVKQQLDPQQSYMINVKEKGSQHRLKLALGTQTFMHGSPVEFTAGMTSHKGKVNKVDKTAYIKTPAGKKHPVSFVQTKGQYQISVPQDLTLANRGELYELLIESRAKTKGLTIRRNAKVAFAVAQPTAQIEGQLQVFRHQADMSLQVASAGRYEISGLVYGTNQQGKLQPMMISHSAYYLQPGQHQVALRFDRGIMQRSGLTAPYELKNLQLKDQSRMALIQRL